MHKSFYGLMLVCLFVFVVKIMAADHYVRPPGTCTNTTLQAPYTNWDIAATPIQWAVNAAILGETVWVSNGVYVLTNYIALTNGIRLKNCSTNPDDTTIDGNLAVRCIYMTNAAAVVDGFTVTRGSIQGYGNGAGIYMLNGTVTNCTVVSNFAGERVGYTAYGAGIYIQTNGSILNSRILYNTITNAYGGGIFADGGGLIKDCLIAFNSSSNRGGGIYLNYGGTVRDSSIISNYASNSGGGLYCYSGTVSNCLIADNIAMTYGAGIYVRFAGFSIQNCIISNNYVISGYGGGVYFRPASWTNYLQDCVIVGNRCANGAGIYCSEWGGIVQNCRVINNYDGQNGAGVMGDQGTIFRNCLIAGNVVGVAGQGGGVYCQLGTNMFENCTIVSNVSGGYGGGIWVKGAAGGTNIFVNSIIYFNQSAYGGQSSNWYTSGGVQVGVLSNSCMAPTNPSGTVLGSGNFADNPLLVDYQALNGRLTANSPCINRGLYLPWMDGVLDLDGHSRVDRFSRNVDVGAYEYIRRGTMYKVY